MTIKLLTTTELSTLIKRAPETLMRWRRLRIGPPFLSVEGRVLYDETEVRQWLDGRRYADTRTRSGNRQAPVIGDFQGHPMQAPTVGLGRVSTEVGFTFDPDTKWQNHDE